ncbi:hypothetical protein KC365_g13176 [Hortaea werneckii]|nr:hypothetical protein KC342_g15454 [Hortaea werneckii]KAI7063494.1 hypothetical protein KC339_g16270 [Hortaea werneckii]KAI7216671.1 hypothetical protein KC365_g13176 [Hortaea werneckii]KAI7399561.1 hypothetical protein KC328_g3993 [Hortaea werneckii]
MADSGAPLIVSSNRFNDIAPFTKRLFASDPKKWGSILPWEFPQNASKKAEDDFVILTFSAKTIRETDQLLGSARKEKFKFLKQAWYSLALWNLNYRVHGAAQQWLQENEGLWKDSEMVGSICGSETTLNAFFFSADQKADYGEKLLMWVMRSVQWEVRQWHGLPQPAQPKMEEKPQTAHNVAQEAVQVNDNIKMPRPGSAGLVENEPKSRPIPMSAQPARAQLANPASLIKDSSQTPTFSLPSTAPSYMSRMPDFAASAGQHSATSVQPKHENANQVPSGRQRGNSHPKRSMSNRWNGRGQPQLQPPFHNPPFPSQSGPSFRTPSSAANNIALPMHGQEFRPHAPEGPPGVPVNPMTAEYAGPNMHVQRYPGPPMSGFSNNAFQQPNPYFQPGQTHPPHGVFASHNAPQLNPYYHTPALLDRTNIDERYDRRTFSGASESSVNMPYASAGAPAMYQDQHGGGNDGRGGHRRQSVTSRGGNGKVRGGYKNGRGASSRGSNGFSAESGRGGKEMFTRHGTFTHDDKPKDHREFEMPHPPANAFAKNRNRHGSVASSNWRRGDHKQVPLGGNGAVNPQQAFNGGNQHLASLPLSNFQGSAPPPMRVMSSEQYGHPPPRNQEDWNRRQYAEKRAISGPGPQYQPYGYSNVFPPIGSGWEGRNLHTAPMRNHGVPAPRPEISQEDRIALQPVKNVIHDELIAESLNDKSKVLIRNHIGDEFTYVNKLILFSIGASVEDHEIQNLFTSVTGIKHSAAPKVDSERRNKTENPYIAARVPGKTYATGSRSQYQCVYIIFETSAQARDALKLSGSMSFGQNAVKIEVPKEYWDVSHMNYPGFGATGARGWHRTFAGPREGYGPPQHAHKSSVSSSLGEVNVGGQSTLASGNKNSIAGGLDAAENKSEDTTPTQSGATTPRAGKKKKNKSKKAVTAAASGGDLRVEALQSSHAGRADSTTRSSSPVFKSESFNVDSENPGVDGKAHEDAMSDKSNVTVVRDSATTANTSLSEAMEPADAENKVSTASRDDSQTKSEPAFSPEMAKDGGFPKVVMPTVQQPADEVGGLNENVETVQKQSFRGPTKATEKAEGETYSKLSKTGSVAANAEQNTTKSETATQDDENVDDSFHTATGSPNGSDGKQKQTQGSTCGSESTGDPIARADAPASATSSPISARVQSPKDAPAETTTKTPKKAPVPHLPRVRVSEPTTLQLKSNDDKKETSDQRTVSGSTIVPPTPAFHTAPTTPAMVSDALSTEEHKESSSAAPADQGAEVTASAEHLDDRTKSEQKLKKPEKSKGPSQTPSLSVFAKPQRTQGKSKKSTKKAKKGTGADLRSFSDVTSETPSRVVSGAVTSDFEAPETSVVSNACDPSAETNDDKGITLIKDISVREVGLARGVEESGDKSEERANNEEGKPAGEADLAEAMETVASSTSPSRSLNERRGIVEILNRLIPGSKQSAQASVSAPQEDQVVDKIQDVGTFTAPKGSPPVTSSKFPVPVAQMQTNNKETSRIDDIGQPFSQAFGIHGADWPRDSGHSGGSVDQQSTGAVGAPAGLGISTDTHTAVNQGVTGNTGKAKKKKKKAGGRRKRAAREALAESEAGLLTESKEGSPEFVDDSTSSTKGETGDKKPFQFLFQANTHPYPSQPLTGTHSQSPSQASNLSGSGSEMSSHTLRRSSQDETPSPSDSLSNDSPTRKKKIVEAQKAQGKNTLITAPPLRHKHKRISSRSSRKKSATGTSPTTSDQSRTIYLHKSFNHESDSDDESSGPKQFDKLIDAQMRNKRRPSMLYLYLGPGKRSEDHGRWEEVEEGREPKTPPKVQEATTKRIPSEEHDEDWSELLTG